MIVGAAGERDPEKLAGPDRFDVECAAVQIEFTPCTPG
jgi:hypothetical protein